MPVPHAFIFGAGHISKSLSKVATLAGFNSMVIDNRDTFANRERFPEAVAVHADEYEEAFPAWPLTKQATSSSSLEAIATIKVLFSIEELHRYCDYCVKNRNLNI